MELVKNVVLFVAIWLTIPLASAQQLEIGKIIVNQSTNGKIGTLSYLINETEKWNVEFDLLKTPGPSPALGGIHLTGDSIAVIHYYYQNFYPPDRAVVHYFSTSGVFLDSHELLWNKNRVRWMSPKDFYGTSAIDSDGTIYLLGLVEEVPQSNIFSSVLAKFDSKGTKISEKTIPKTNKIFASQSGIVYVLATGHIEYQDSRNGQKSNINGIYDVNDFNGVQPIIESGIAIEQIGKHAGVQLKNINVNENGDLVYIGEYGNQLFFKKTSAKSNSGLLDPKLKSGQSVFRFETLNLSDGRSIVNYVIKERKLIEVGKKKKMKNKRLYSLFSILYNSNNTIIDRNDIISESLDFPPLPKPIIVRDEILYSVQGESIISSDYVYKNTKEVGRIKTPHGIIPFYPSTQNYEDGNIIFRMNLKEHLLIKY